MGDLLDIPEFDAIASLAIGVILAVVTALLAYECKGLLIGERATREVVTGVREIIEGEPGILQVNELLTLHLAPDDIFLNVSLYFDDRLSSVDAEAIVSNLEIGIKATFPEVRGIFIEAQSWTGHTANEQPSR